MTFIEKVRNFNDRDDVEPDTTPEEWAARMFSVSIVLGNMLEEGVEITPDVIDSLALAMAKAPLQTLAAGTMFALKAKSDVDKARARLN